MAKNINQYQSSPDFWSQTIFKGSLLLCEFQQINALYYQHLLEKLHINWISVQKMCNLQLICTFEQAAS